ncbi:Ig-like domain-containing protein, partial [Pontibacter aydingkolensis]
FHEGTSYTTPSLSSTTTYFVSSYSTTTGCEGSTRTAVTATINPIPAAPTATGASRCGTGTVTLTAAGAPAGGSYRWYTVATGGTAITGATSDTYTTPSISATTTYYVSTVSDQGCESPRTTVTATVNPDNPAVYSSPNNYTRNELSNGKTVATVTDPDGAITSAAVIGTSLPSFLTLNTTSGAITVNSGTPVNGVYDRTIRITDANGCTSDVPVTINITEEAAPLPVELVYFTASVTTNGALLKWLTASETDNDRFEIERSRDGKAFTKIGTVNGNGTSNRSIKYAFTDVQPLADVSYYRLKQVDYDGTSKYSKTISIQNNRLSTHAVLQAYPNPFNKTLLVTITAPLAEQAVLTLYNLQGRVLLSIPVELQQNINNFELDTQELPTGIYILKVTSTTTDITTKLLKR